MINVKLLFKVSHISTHVRIRGFINAQGLILVLWTLCKTSPRSVGVISEVQPENKTKVRHIKVSSSHKYMKMPRPPRGSEQLAANKCNERVHKRMVKLNKFELILNFKRLKKMTADYDKAT